jgi:exodeoxyribonuclease V beta subunit
MIAPTSIAPWKEDAPLPDGVTMLLEASAGTGKTHQISNLALRLVAEYGVNIDRILTITFTNAATAELKVRIRRRLGEARAMFEHGPEGITDAVLLRLYEDEGQRDTRRSRIEMALQNFDLAPISTIHGFSQQMLTQFAFESGQERDLELLDDKGAIVDELIDDAMALTFSDEKLDDLLLMRSLGWTRKTLVEVAQAVTGAVSPHVEPALEGDLDAGDIDAQLDEIRSGLRTKMTGLREEIIAFQTWWDSDEGHAAREGYRAVANSDYFKRWQDVWVDSALVKLDSWVHGLMRKSTQSLEENAVVRRQRMLKDWKQRSDLTLEPCFRMTARLESFLERRDELIRTTRPLLAFAHGTRARVARELVRRRQLTFDSMLSLLARAVSEDRERMARGEEGRLITAMRKRYEVALVDEFQDTDASQWTVLEAVFGRGSGRRLVLIGDPKQAIYAFRGADVFVYLRAAASVDVRYTMTTNWRSDGGYVRAMNSLWRAGSNAFELPAHSGGAGIDYLEVGVAPKHEYAKLSNMPVVEGRVPRPLEIRWFDNRLIYPEEGGFKVSNKTVAKRFVARSVAREALAIVSARDPAWHAHDGAEPITKGFGPGDLAVLVNSHSEARLIRRELAAVGLPSVVNATGSVFGSKAATWLRAWLAAVAGAGRDAWARVAATTPMFGWTAQKLAAELEDSAGPWAKLCDDFASWSRDFEARGFIYVFEAACQQYGIMGRILGGADGERHATDLRHLVELAQRHLHEDQCGRGARELERWLVGEAPESETDSEGNEERALRLESDAKAVRIVTIHASKGLEYPIVFLPFSWATEERKVKEIALWHDPRHEDGRPVLDLRATDDPDRQLADEGQRREARQEKVRLLYVALTRARHQTIAWFGPAGKDGLKFDQSTLGRLLLRSDTGEVPTFEKDLDEAQLRLVTDRLKSLCERSNGAIGWSLQSALPAGRYTPAEVAAEYRARDWRGRSRLESSIVVTSFTRLAKASESHDEEPVRDVAPVVVTGFRPEVGPQDEVSRSAGGLEPARLEALSDLVGDAMEGSDEPSRLDEMWGGKAVGIWIHSVFEHLDFQAIGGFDGELVEPLVTRLAKASGIAAPPEQLELVASAIPAIVETPLEGSNVRLPPGFSLRQVSKRDRLDELRFDLRMNGGAHPEALPRHAHAAMRRRLNSDWPGVAWLEQLLENDARQAIFPSKSGILVGAIDLVFRAPDADTGKPRYYVADYKTNRIVGREPGGRSRRLHYTGPWMNWEMGRHAYHLQALIYTLALHRHLKMRLPDYDYDTHFGGHLYLFLRGMEGENSPKLSHGGRLGVYQDRWPKDVVIALDEALSGGESI